MTKKPQTSKSVKSIKASPAKVKKVVKATKAQKAPVKKAAKAKFTKKTLINDLKAPRKALARKALAKSPALHAGLLTTTKAPKRPKKAAGSSGQKGYTPDQYKKFMEEKKSMQQKSNQELKDMLRKNMQSMSGNKDDLVYKVADGIVLGRIPRCPKCFGGRPKFDFKKGTYYCSGYRDDEDFKNCKSTFALNDIKRDPWE